MKTWVTFAVLLLVSSCCSTTIHRRITEDVLHAHEKTAESRSCSTAEDSLFREIDRVGAFVNITGFPAADDSMAVMTELALNALLYGGRMNYLFLKVNRDVATVYHYGAVIYKQKQTGYSTWFGRERRLVDVTIHRYSRLRVLCDRVMGRCRVGSQEASDYCITAGYRFKWRKCGEEVRRYRYYVTWRSGKPVILSYTPLEAFNACCGSDENQ